MRRLITMLLILMLILSACGGETTAPQETTAPTQAAESGVITVSTVDELLAAIAPGAEIVLEAGEYRLDQAADYGKSESRYYTWDDLGLGWYGLQIQYVNGLSIRGAGKGLTSLTTAERMSNVLNIVDCNDISVSDMTLGHTEQTEACEGGVIRLDNADNIRLSGLGLYGCGTLGVSAYECENVAVENCEIYECSVDGVQISRCRNVTIAESSFHDLGKDSPVFQVFSVYGCSDVEISGCVVADNYVQNLIDADWGVTLCNNLFRSNRVSAAAFHLTGEGIVFQNNTFEENELRNWYAPGSSIAVDEQGNQVLMENPAAKPVETEPGVATPVSTGEQKQVRVSNVNDFLAAIASDTCITVDARLLDLSQAKTYKEAGDLTQTETYQPENASYYWKNNYDGPCLVISGVSNLTIKAEGSDRKAHTLSATPRYADVLTFENCSAITLSGFTAGHTKEQGYCTGGVFAFENCADILVDNCGMYGCGTEGVNASYTTNLQIVNSEIYECSYNGIVLWNAENVAISGTVIRDIRNEWQGEAPHFHFSESRNITLDGEPLDGNYVGN